eukprot:gene9306-18427_t
MLSSLQSGITEEEIDALAKMYDFKIPREIRCHLRLFNGQNAGANSSGGLFGDFSFYDVSQTVRMLSLREMIQVK